MGAACSLGDPPTDVHPVHPTPLHSSHPSTSDPSPSSTSSLPTHLWTSIVVGEFTKPPPSSTPQPPPPLPIYDDTAPTLTVVQSMIKSGANYAIIRKATGQPDAASTGAAAGVPQRGGRRGQADVYVGMMDWRDLNALLVMVCKGQRMQGGQQAGQADAKPTPSAATAAAQNALRLAAEADERRNSTKAEEVAEVEVDDAEPAHPVVVAAALSPSPPALNRPVSSSANGVATPPRPVGRVLVPSSLGTASPTSAARVASRVVSPIQLTTTAAAPVVSVTTLSPASAERKRMTIAPNTYRIECTAPLSPSLAPSPPISFASPTSASSSSSSSSPSSPTPLTPYLHFLDMKRTPIGLISNLSQRNPLTVVNTACPLLGAAQLLTGVIGQAAAGDGGGGGGKQQVGLWRAKDKKGKGKEKGGKGGGMGGEGGGKGVPPPSRPELYRLAVLDKDGRFQGCLTQLQLAAWVRARMDKLGDRAEQSLQSLGLGRSRRVMTIGWRSPVFTALLLMHDRRLSALAIVNDGNGQLVGTISCSDIRHLFLAPDLMLTLSKPVSAFVSMLRQSTSYWHVNLQGEAGGVVSASPSVVVKQTMGLREAVDVLLTAKVRRAWVVNDTEQPIGMLTIGDIVKLALPQPATHQQQPQQHSSTPHRAS